MDHQTQISIDGREDALQAPQTAHERPFGPPSIRGHLVAPEDVVITRDLAERIARIADHRGLMIHGSVHNHRVPAARWAYVSLGFLHGPPEEEGSSR